MSDISFPLSARSHGGLAQFMAQRAPGPVAGSDQIVDLSVNVNPYGPCPSIRQALEQCDPYRYPDPEACELTQAWAEFHQVEPTALMMGNGGADLMWTYVWNHIKPDDPVLILEPTFSEFRSACEHRGLPVVEYRAHSHEHFRWSPETIEQLIQAHEIRHIYICQPNSPTGASFDPDWLCWLAQRYRNQLQIVLDHAFLSLSPLADQAFLAYPDNVIRIYSLTKEHTIPGVRLGYLISSPAIVQALRPGRASWSLNSYALAAGLTAVNEYSFVKDSYARIRQDQSHAVVSLQRNDIHVHAAAAPMLLIKVGDSPRLQQRLWQRGFLVRDGSSYHLPEWIRVCPRPADDFDPFIEALKEELR